MSEGAWALAGLVIGALLGLVPRFFEMRSNRISADQEQTARLRAMLAGVLMKCVHSTNEFLKARAATIGFEPTSTDRSDVTDDDLHAAMDLAFEMKTAWMETLVSFGDPVKGNETSDSRRGVIQQMLNELDVTYDRYQGGGVTRDQLNAQLGEIARISRTRLNELIGVGPKQ